MDASWEMTKLVSSIVLAALLGPMWFQLMNVAFDPRGGSNVLAVLLYVGVSMGIAFAVASIVKSSISLALELRSEYCFDCNCDCGEDDDPDDDPDGEDIDFEVDPDNRGVLMYPPIPRSA